MWFNPIIRWLLKSPLHFTVSGSMMLMIYTSRRSGKTYETPMNYVQDGDDYYTLSSSDRKWWRNLRGGEQVKLILRGKEVPVRAEVIEEKDQVVETLARIVTVAPQYGKYLGMELADDGSPYMMAVARAAENRVVVRSSFGGE